MMKEFLSKLRKDYRLGELTEADVASDPITQFENWLTEAVNVNVPEPNAMVLSTVDTASRPHSRVVLLRNFDVRGFVFYTNYDSSKGHEIEANPFVCLNFFWVDIERQVRIEGTASKISLTESNEYFQSRPRNNQLSAWASPQSSVVESREELVKQVEAMDEKFKNLPQLERPPFWGGYRIEHRTIEFWQGRPGRLHDRIRYTRLENDSWKIERLAP